MTFSALPAAPLACLLVGAATAPAARHGCAAPPEARLQASRFEGTQRPPLVLLRCRTSGLEPPRKLVWSLGPALRRADPVRGTPLDDDALLVQLAEPAAPAATTVECQASDGAGRRASASAQLAAITITAATVGPDRIVIEGSGFGPARGEDDAVFVAPPRGRLARLEPGCAPASWSDGRIVACLPPGMAAHGGEVRVQSRGRLGVGLAK
jgi:hypothetical protein